MEEENGEKGKRIEGDLKGMSSEGRPKENGDDA